MRIGANNFWRAWSLGFPALQNLLEYFVPFGYNDNENLRVLTSLVNDQDDLAPDFYDYDYIFMRSMCSSQRRKASMLRRKP